MAENTPKIQEWRTKPSDRFILKWIKVNLSARITPHLTGIDGLRPWMITVCSTALGITGGIIFALGWAWPAGLIAGVGQILDGVDGQLARLRGQQSKGGAYLDSVLDRYADGAMMIGMIIYLMRKPNIVPEWLILLAGAMALIGSNLISYSTARANSLGLPSGKPTLASKGTRMTVMVLCALGSFFWPPLPLAALFYLAIHPNLVMLARIEHAVRS